MEAFYLNNGEPEIGVGEDNVGLLTRFTAVAEEGIAPVSKAILLGEGSTGGSPDPAFSFEPGANGGFGDNEPVGSVRHGRVVGWHLVSFPEHLAEHPMS